MKKLLLLLPLLLCAVRPARAQNYVQSKPCDAGSVMMLTCTFDNPLVIGHTVLVTWVAVPTLSTNTSVATDSDLNSYVMRVSTSGSGGNASTLGYETIATTTNALAVTITNSVSESIHMVITELNVGAFNFLKDGWGNGDGPNGTTSASIPANQFYFLFSTYQGGSTGITWTVTPSGYTQRELSSVGWVVTYDQFYAGAQTGYVATSTDSGGAAYHSIDLLIYGAPPNTQTQIGGFLVGP